MTNLKILNPKEARAFDQAPEFTGEDRKKYFRLTNLVNTSITTFINPHVQVGFLLHLGYFKATGKFFTAQNFHKNDVNYIIRQLNLSEDDVNMKKYSKKILYRHKPMILDILGILPFQDKREEFDTQLNLLISQNRKPVNILLTMIGWLRRQKIEVPSYHLFATTITELINLQEKKLSARLGSILTEKQKIVLDGLMQQSVSSPKVFKLTELKHINQSEKPGKIAKSIDMFMEVKEKFDILLPAIEALELSTDIWRTYSHWVMTARSSQLEQFTNPYQRYLYLMAFVHHQYHYRQDFFIKILINSTNKVNNDFKKYKQVTHYQNKEKQDTYLDLTIQKKDYYKTKWDHTCQIIPNSEFTSDEKVDKIAALIKEQIQAVSILDDRLEELENSVINASNQQYYYNFVHQNFRYLKNRVHEIITSVSFNEDTSNELLIDAISNYKNLKDHAFCRKLLPLFSEKQRKMLYDDKNKPKVGLCKALFYLLVSDGIKSGNLNLKHSYKYRSIEEYLISLEVWEKDKQQLLERAGLQDFIEIKRVIDKLKKQLDKQYNKTNSNILDGINSHVTVNEISKKVSVETPGVEKPITEPIADLLESFKYMPIGDILSDIHQATGFMDAFQHRNIKYVKSYPKEEEFIAGLIGRGCNIGTNKMGQISRGINESTLINTVKWYFGQENLVDANDRIVEIIEQLPIYDLFKHDKDLKQTSSDGQKYNMAVDSLNASHSFKYSGTGKGVSVYSFVDEAIATFYSTVITASEREATYVLDGIMHNEVYWEEDKKLFPKTWVHHTDTHGVSDVMFAATNLLGVSLSPRIKGLKDRNIYTFEGSDASENKDYVLTPEKVVIDEDIIEKQWDSILRVMTTIRLKETTASSIFSRLNSYAKHNPLYQGFQEMGKIYKSLFILKYYDELELRQMTEKQLNKVERSHQFALAIFFDNNREMIQELKEDQDVTVACRILIQNAIVLWNCLRLSEKIILTKEKSEKAKIIEMIKGGTACSWQHINMQGIYEFRSKPTSNFMRVEIYQILDMKVA